MRFLTTVVALGIALAALSPAARADFVVPEHTPIPRSFLAAHGETMTQTEALARVSFHPFQPSARYTEVAILPPFHGPDTNAMLGIGYAYSRNGHSLVLREWPRASGAISPSFPRLAKEGGCGDVYLTRGDPDAIRGVGWMTNQTVFVLETDQKSIDKRAVRDELARLVKRGACR